MVVQDHPETSCGVCSDTRVLLGRGDESQKTGKESSIRCKVKLVDPVERRVPQEVQNVDNQLRQRGDLWLRRSTCRWSNGVNDEQRSLENWLELKNGLLAVSSRSVRCKETSVTRKVVLQKLDVFFIFANRLQLALNLFNSPSFHDLLGHFGRYRERLQKIEQKSHLFPVVGLVLLEKSFGADLQNCVPFGLSKYSAGRDKLVLVLDGLGCIVDHSH